LPKTREEAPNVKLVHLSSAGADRAIKNPLFLEGDVKFTTSSGIHGPQIAEWVIMTTLVRTHFYNTLYESQRKGKWDRTGAWGVKDLVGQKLAILGYGSIGRQG
jgi:phosphoglycerate dehydrogenase-like enzyme